MVTQERLKGKGIFVCELCGFGYGTRALAEQCEDYCAKHHSCSLEITKNAVKVKMRFKKKAEVSAGVTL